MLGRERTSVVAERKKGSSYCLKMGHPAKLIPARHSPWGERYHHPRPSRPQIVSNFSIFGLNPGIGALIIRCGVPPATLSVGNWDGCVRFTESPNLLESSKQHENHSQLNM